MLDTDRDMICLLCTAYFRRHPQLFLLLCSVTVWGASSLCPSRSITATSLPCPWDSPGKNTGVGCHFLLQCIKVKSESEDAQSCPTLSDPMDCSLPGSSVHGIFQARVLEWGAIAFSGLQIKGVYKKTQTVSTGRVCSRRRLPGVHAIGKT